jgi:hypothetical protein
VCYNEGEEADFAVFEREIIMKSIKDFNEQEKIYYYKCKSRVLDILLFELIVAVIVWNFISISDVLREIGLLLMIAIPVVFYHVKIIKICPADGGETAGAVFLAVCWSIYFFQGWGILTAGMLIVIWGVVLFDVFAIYKRRRKGN